MIEVSGIAVTAPSPGGRETHIFASAAEAQAKAAFVDEALSWIGTPFRDCADVKGPNGAVDCAMLLVRSAVDSGLLAPFDPRPYPARHMLHSGEQRFLGWIADKLGAKPVEHPRFGDVIVWQFGRCFSHGAVMINSEEVVHAYAYARRCIVTRIDSHPLRFASLRGREFLRPVKYFDVWRA